MHRISKVWSYVDHLAATTKLSLVGRASYYLVTIMVEFPSFLLTRHSACYLVERYTGLFSFTRKPTAATITDLSLSVAVCCAPTAPPEPPRSSAVTLEFWGFTTSTVGANSPLLGWIRVDVELNKDFSYSSGKGFLTTGPQTETGNVVTDM
ncbi:hypothetical protein E5676_scaffold111G001390 [Cucumis melo var. makuwa]|uniref:Uncharacterized protein n=1 Tax=Cucumis melo var. makuwa TaxID=1194695 RepID=A0A5D3DSJ9_CUCMM|nr:hypothetical protein E5676_scaffold111G001390 [Cucumis melo var. makuwa]